MALSATHPSFGLVECVCSCSASSAEVYRSFTDARLGASRISPFCASHGFRGHFHASAKVGRERAQCALSGHMLTLAWLETEAREQGQMIVPLRQKHELNSWHCARFV